MNGWTFATAAAFLLLMLIAVSLAALWVKMHGRTTDGPASRTLP